MYTVDRSAKLFTRIQGTQVYVLAEERLIAYTAKREKRYKWENNHYHSILLKPENDHGHYQSSYLEIFGRTSEQEILSNGCC